MRYLIYDSGPEYGDRYTIFYKNNGWKPWKDYIAASEKPFHPQGFGQHGESDPFWRRIDRAHLGRPVRFKDLPPDVRRFAKMQEGEA